MEENARNQDYPLEKGTDRLEKKEKKHKKYGVYKLRAYMGCSDRGKRGISVGGARRKDEEG